MDILVEDTAEDDRIWFEKLIIRTLMRMLEPGLIGDADQVHDMVRARRVLRRMGVQELPGLTLLERKAFDLAERHGC